MVKAGIPQGSSIPVELLRRSWIVINPSRVERFRKCKRLYLNAHILQLHGETVRSPRKEIGLAVHSILADAHGSGRCVTHADLEGLDGEDASLIAQLVDSHRALCASHTDESSELVKIESELAWWDRKTRTFFSGRPDTVWIRSNLLSVRDYKTGRRPEMDHRYREDTSIYAILAAASYPGIRPIQVEFEYLAERELEIVAFDEYGVAEALDLIRSAAKEIRETVEFPPTPGSHCMQCNFRSTCPDSGA